jgi:hypothetical protein
LKFSTDAASELRKEIALMREKSDYFATQLKAKDEELRILKEKNGAADAKV